MLFSIASCAALLSLVAIPQARAADIKVVVGGPNTFAFNPPSVNAVAGDRVIFSFREKSHSATQSSLAAPCVQAPGGFDSGLVPVAAGDVSDNHTAVFTVQSLDPVWVFCKPHCQSQGMVFAINPGDKLAQFQAAAKGSTAGASSAGAPASSATAPAASSAAAPAASGAPPLSNNHQVVVGGTGKLYFSPSNITAKAGDTITFQFQQKNHTVTQSNFANPCKPLAQNGFDSGFKPVDASVTSNFPTWTLQINDTTPIWAYCAQGNHCTSGMVFAVNTVESGPNNFEAFKNKATGASAGAASPSGTAASGGVSLKMTSGAGFAAVFVALAFGLFL
jgi:plastocyanin